MSSSKKKLIPILDMFRLLAALMVVFVHYEIFFAERVVYGAFGTTALSWFFVLSGFIMAYTYPSLDSREDYRRFYLHRVIRIYPVYFLAVIVSAGLVSIGYNILGEGYFEAVRRPFELSYDLPEVKDNGFWLWATLRHLTFTQSLSSIETLNLVFNGPLWSLVLEAYFYICFPVLLILLRPFNTPARIITALLAGWALQYLLILAFLPDAETYNLMNLNVPVYTNPMIRGLEFVFGMLLYKGFSLMPPLQGTEKTRLWPLLLALLAYILVNSLGETLVPYQFRTFFMAVPVVVLMVLAMARAHWYPQGAALKFCVWCGGISYVLYCFHWPLMEMIRLWNILPDSLPFALHLPLLVVVLLAISHVIYKFIETPARKVLYRRFEKARQ